MEVQVRKLRKEREALLVASCQLAKRADISGQQFAIRRPQPRAVRAQPEPGARAQPPATRQGSCANRK